jgi:hypothetical protein
MRVVDDEHRNERYLEAPLDPALLPYADEIVGLAVQLRGLDLIDEDNVGKLKANATLGVWAIEAGHPDGGPWLYGREDADTIVATRMRPDGQREHAVLDEYGMPTEWRVAIRPEFN